MDAEAALGNQTAHRGTPGPCCNDAASRPAPSGSPFEGIAPQSLGLSACDLAPWLPCSAQAPPPRRLSPFCAFAGVTDDGRSAPAA